MDNIFVTFEHLHSVSGLSSSGTGFCHRGARALCARYNIDWQTVVSEGGVSSSTLLATGDALAIRLVEHARQVEHGR